MKARWLKIEPKDKRHKWIVPTNQHTSSVMAKCSSCGKRQRVWNANIPFEPFVGRIEGFRFVEVNRGQEETARRG